jgi:ribonuclease HI
MSAAVPKKRKASSAPESKFYGVKAGKVPGVYTLWSDCQEMTTGFKGASCMFFIPSLFGF